MPTPRGSSTMDVIAHHRLCTRHAEEWIPDENDRVCIFVESLVCDGELVEYVRADILRGAVEALREIVSGPDASKGENYGCLDLHEARTIAREALDRDDLSCHAGEGIDSLRQQLDGAVGALREIVHRAETPCGAHEVPLPYDVAWAEQVAIAKAALDRLGGQ